MRTLKIIRQSFSAVLANKGRSFLTILGIVIGIASVIALMSLGSGAKKDITERISVLGTANVTVTPGASVEDNGVGPGGGRPGARLTGSGQASTLTQADLDALQGLIGKDGIQEVTGNISGTAVFDTADGEQRFEVLGTSADYFDILNLELARGKAYSPEEVSSVAKTIVLGKELASDVFGAQDPVGRTLDISGVPYTVTGVLADVEESGFTNPDIQGFIPYTAAREAFGAENFNSLIVRTDSEEHVDAAKKEVESALLASHGIEDVNLADFTVRSSEDLLATVTSITDIMTAFLGGIAAISLLVGGIGIMNIMLVSVTERTREIGLRKAVGARTGHIMVQFLTEALLLTVTGGLLGVVFGRLLSGLAGRILNFSTVVTGSSIVLAVCVAAFIGIVFGLYPAAKAARLDPINALRYE
ncbi:MAG: ABC transporter permease [Actinomycetota bacterium]